MRTKSILLTAAFAVMAMVGSAQVQKVYLNPLQSEVNVDNTKKNRIETMILMGLGQIRIMKTTRGQVVVDNAKLAADGYYYAITPTITKASHTKDEKKTDPYTAEISVNVVLKEVATGKEIASKILNGEASDKDVSQAYFEAANSFSDEIVAFIDNSLPVVAELVTIDNANSDEEAKAVVVNKGSDDGVRKDMMFVAFKEVNGQKTEIGKARCEQVTSAHEALLKVYGKNDGDKEIANVFNNMDENTKLVFESRAKKSWGQFGGALASVFTAKKERGNYYDPNTERSAKLRVGLMGCVAGNSNVNANQVKKLESVVLDALSKVTTIALADKYYPTIEDAQAAGLDGLINITFNNAAQSTSKTKEGKTQYEAHVYISIEGINVHDGSWIEIRDANQPWTSTENAQKPMEDAINALKDDIKKFAEDVFPVAGIVTEGLNVKQLKTKKAKKNENEGQEKQRGSVETASINIGTTVGVRKNMMFDIYKQIKGQGEDSRVFLGTGKVTGDPEADKAVIKVKGSNKGDEVMYDLLQNMDEQVEIVVISRANIDRVASVLKNLDGFLNKL